MAPLISSLSTSTTTSSTAASAPVSFQEKVEALHQAIQQRDLSLVKELIKEDPSLLIGNIGDRGSGRSNRTENYFRPTRNNNITPPEEFRPLHTSLVTLLQENSENYSQGAQSVEVRKKRESPSALLTPQDLPYATLHPHEFYVTLAKEWVQHPLGRENALTWALKCQVPLEILEFLCQEAQKMSKTTGQNLLNLSDGLGQTPLTTLAQISFSFPKIPQEYSACLIKYGAHIDQSNNLKYTPLTVAALENNRLVFTTLFDQGANIAKKEKDMPHLLSLFLIKWPGVIPSYEVRPELFLKQEELEQYKKEPNSFDQQKEDFMHAKPLATFKLLLEKFIDSFLPEKASLPHYQNLFKSLFITALEHGPLLINILDELQKIADSFSLSLFELLNLRNSQKEPLFYIAGRRGYFPFIERLFTFESQTDSREEKFQNRRTALLGICEGGHIKTFLSLLNQAPSLIFTLNNAFPTGYSPLQLICLYKHRGLLESFLEVAQKVFAPEIFLTLLNYKNKRDKNNTALHYAAAQGNREIVEILFQAGADCTIQNIDKNTPLHFACVYQRREVLHFFLTQESPQVLIALKIENNRAASPLFMSCFVKDEESIRMILTTYPVLLHQKSSYEDFSLFLMAVYKGLSVEFLNLLLSQGAKIEERTKQDMTAFHLACEKGHVGIAQFLLQHHSFSLTDTILSGATALHLSCNTGHLPMVQWLLTFPEIREKINSVDADGSTALHLACSYGHFSLISLLLENRAQINLLDNKRRLPLHCACRYPVNLPLLEQLYGNNKDLMYQEDDEFHSPLFFLFLSKENYSIIKYFISSDSSFEKHADYFEATLYGLNPLMSLYLLSLGHVEKIHTLQSIQGGLEYLENRWDNEMESSEKHKDSLSQPEQDEIIENKIDSLRRLKQIFETLKKRKEKNIDDPAFWKQLFSHFDEKKQNYKEALEKAFPSKNKEE